MSSLLDRLPDEAEILYPPRDRVEFDIEPELAGVYAAQERMEHLLDRHLVIFRCSADGTADYQVIFDVDAFRSDLAAETPEVRARGEAVIHRWRHGLTEYAECARCAHPG